MSLTHLFFFCSGTKALACSGLPMEILGSDLVCFLIFVLIERNVKEFIFFANLESGEEPVEGRRYGGV